MYLVLKLLKNLITNTSVCLNMVLCSRSKTSVEIYRLWSRSLYMFIVYYIIRSTSTCHYHLRPQWQNRIKRAITGHSPSLPRFEFHSEQISMSFFPRINSVKLAKEKWFQLDMMEGVGLIGCIKSVNSFKKVFVFIIQTQTQNKIWRIQ